MKKALLGSLVSAALLTSFNLSAASASQAVDAQAATDNASKVSQQKIDNYADSAESALAQYKAALRQGRQSAYLQRAGGQDGRLPEQRTGLDAAPDRPDRSDQHRSGAADAQDDRLPRAVRGAGPAIPEGRAGGSRRGPDRPDEPGRRHHLREVPQDPGGLPDRGGLQPHHRILQGQPGQGWRREDLRVPARRPHRPALPVPGRQ